MAYYGAKHWIGFKKQVTPGTPETEASVFLPSQKLKMTGNPKPIERKVFMGTGMKLPSLAGWKEPTGSTTVEVTASQPHPWYWALGGLATTTPAGTAKLHTITDNETPVPLTVHGNRVYDKATQYDAYVNKLKLNAKPGEVATLDIEWLAAGHLDGETLTDTPAFVTDTLVCTAVSISIGGSVVTDITSCEIEWDGSLEATKVLTTGGEDSQVIRRKGSPSVTGKLEFLDFSTTEMAKMVAATAFEIKVELQGAVIETTYKKFLRITLPACQYTGGFDEDISEEVVTGSADFSAFYDTTTEKQILVEAQNTIASLA